MSRHIYTLRKPAGWHREAWREALPLGNGLTGVLIPGAIAEESITFNRHDFWLGGGDEPVPDITDTFREMREMLDRGDYAAANRQNLMHALQEKKYGVCPGAPCPLGWLDMTFLPTAPFKGYRRGVNMRTAEAFVEFTIDGCHYRRDLFVSRADDITVIRMTADKPFTVTYGFRLFREAEGGAVCSNGFRLSAPKEKECGASAARVLFLGDYDSVITGAELNKLEVTGREYLILVRCGSHGSSTELESFEGETYESLLARHTALHTPLYDAATIELADDETLTATNEQLLADAYDDVASPALIERMWRFGRYLFISAASDKGNPVPLYGLWHGREYLPWAQYVANENVEMTYWHTMVGGLAYAVPALLRYYTSKTEVFRECARQMFGMRGIWISAYTAPNTAGAGVPVSVISNWISCAGWLCRHFWDYYLYTRDENLLREEILPFMHEAALFYQDYAVADGDFIRLYPSVSPENTPTGRPDVVAQNATMDFAIMKELLTHLLEGIRITGLYADEAEGFRTLLARIPAYQLNEDGAVKEWMHPDIKDNYHHRHLSHIYPVFPGTEVSAHNQPALFEAFRKAVSLRKLGSQSGWSLTHMASIYARIGEAEKSLELLDIMAKGVVMDSLLTTHNDWRNMGMTMTWGGDATEQLDANFGAVNAIQEMIFCPQESALSFLPALPSRLAHGSARGLCFPEGTVDILWTADGHVEITVRAARDLDTAVLLCGKERDRIALCAGESATLLYQR
ncbi:MAG: glycoside hydrolase family 95 protein [Ruminococcaceae bacterium]|nr:glycoside hydrolase family 95 protein [Oscillospiraceae bacterium]